jgi:hypothetical protein
MSRKKRMQSVRDAKDRRAKKIAIAGGVVLALLLAWEVPHFLGGKKSAAPPPATTTVPGTTAPGTAPVTTTPPATAPGVVAASATPATSTKLPNSDLLPKHSKQQLTGFSTFASKDPFAQQVTATTGLTGSAGSAGSSSPTSPKSTTTTATTAQRNKPVLTARTLAQSGAVRILVNGRPESVRVGASFPSANPVFRLVSLSRGGVRIGIANGSYSSGAQTVSLGLNRTVTLVDTTNGTRYKLRLLGS